MPIPITEVPRFTSDGILPIGTYPVSFVTLRASHLVVGGIPETPTSWNSVWRASLVDRAEVLVRQLWSCGVTDVFLDGSFVEAKPHPNDVDGYFECDVLDIARGTLPYKLNALDPHKVWTWDPASRRRAPGSTKKQLPMWRHYRVELYPHYRGLMSGITDQWGNDLQFPAAFRQQRHTGFRKGIIQVVPGDST